MVNVLSKKLDRPETFKTRIFGGTGDKHITVPSEYRPRSEILEAVTVEIEGIPATLNVNHERGKTSLPLFLSNLFDWKLGDVVNVRLLGFHTRTEVRQ